LQVTDSTVQFLFVIYRRRELFQVKSLTWLLDRTLLVGDSKDRPNRDVVFDLPTSRVHDLCQRAIRRQRETEREQILAVDLNSKTFTFSRADCIMDSVRSKLDPKVRINVADQVAVDAREQRQFCYFVQWPSNG
jgi:hypothetical protein